MNILFIYDSPLCPEKGGTERATKLAMDELTKRGHTAIGLVHAARTQPDVWYYNGNLLNSLTDFLRSNSIDIVVNQIAFNYWLLESFLRNGGELWHRNGGKIISFMHLDPTPAPKKKLSRYFDNWTRKSFFAKIKRLGLIVYLPLLNRKIDNEYKYSMRYLYEHSDRYILMSPSFAPIFSDLCKIDTSTKVRFITNMLTFPNIENDSILESKQNIVLVVARMDDEQKNISFILDVWNKLKDRNGFKLHIVGGGKDEEMLKQKASKIPDVYFESQQSPLKWYQKSDIFLMASPREGWGLTITESLQCGVVPIVLDTSLVFKDIITNGVDGFLPKNKQEYVTVLQKLILDKCVRTNMAKQGLKSARRYLPSAIGMQWDDVLSELNRE